MSLSKLNPATGIAHALCKETQIAFLLATIGVLTILFSTTTLILALLGLVNSELAMLLIVAYYLPAMLSNIIYWREL